MSRITLKINDEDDFEINHPLITIGRTADNDIALNDSNVSRYHARIEQRDDGFWLIDQGSSNGTFVNSTKIDDQILLQNDDIILFGGSSKVVFENDAEKPVDESSPVQATVAETVPKSALPETKRGSALVLIAGALAGLAVISVVAAGLIYLSISGKKCETSARITSPESGEMLTAATDIELEVRNPQCVQTAVFLLDGQEIASSSNEPFNATIDPKQFGDLSDGLNHSLKILLVDAKGEKQVQSDEVLLAFESLATPTPTPESSATQPPEQTQQKASTSSKQASSIETQEMAKRLLKQFSGSSNYKLSQEFLIEVGKKLPEYFVEGYFNRAAQYRDVINVAFVQEQNLDVPLGYILAMSRSKFSFQKQGQEEGLWRMNADFVTANAFNGMCANEILSDPSQNCAAKSAALYLKAIVLNVFEGDIIYAVACFGMTPQEAFEFKASLPADRSDVWKVLKSPKQRDEVVKFFAAGIVAENPQKFGLKKDRPISELYRNLMGN